MTSRRWIPLTLIAAALVLMVAATVWAATGAQDAEPAAPLAPVGTAFTYQGQLKSDGEPVTASCDMEFRLYADDGGSTQVGPLVSIPVSVAEGYFTAELDFGSGAFDGEARWLGIQVQCTGDPGMVDLGLQALTSAPYALSAPWSGLSGVPAGFADGLDDDTTYNAGTGLDLDHGFFSIEEAFRLPGPCAHGAPAEFNTHDNLWHCGTDAVGWQPAKVIVVAKSGGDYTSVQAAIDSISGATADNPYLVWVAPGVYEEQVTMVPYVHLKGAGQEATIITSDADATLYLAGYTSLRDLTVRNVHTSGPASAMMASASSNVTRTLVADVMVWGLGSGSLCRGITLQGSDTRVTLLDVTAHAEGGTGYSYGLSLQFDASAILQGGSYTASGGSLIAYGIQVGSSGSVLEATNVSALARNTTGGSTGLYNDEGTAILRGGTFAAHGGAYVYGINSGGSSAILEAESVTVEGLDGDTNSYGLYNGSGAMATLHGGSFTARGGSVEADAIYNNGSGSTLQADGISVLAADSAADLGLRCGTSTNTYVSHSILEGSLYSVYGVAGTEITHSRVVGGDVDGDVEGAVTCVAVSYGPTFYPDTCP